MDDILGEIGKGFFRVIGYLLAEIFYGTVCYWVGWPICKLVSFGNYPKSKQLVYFEEDQASGFWCSAVGLLCLIAGFVFFAGIFTGSTAV